MQFDDRGKAGRVATVVIDNPTKLNTLTPDVMRALIDALDTLHADTRLRAVVLRGEGERAFIGGADIRELGKLDAGSAEAFITLVHRCCDGLRRLPVPVIARIRGYTLGAGLEIAAACDMRVASTDSHFGMPEVRIGIPSVVEAALLPQLIGWGRTRLLLLTGDTIDAAKAERWGLVEELVTPENLDATVGQLVDSILVSGPRAVRLQKRLMTDWEDLPLRAAVRKGIECLVEAFHTDEPRQLMTQFLAEMAARKRS